MFGGKHFVFIGKFTNNDTMIIKKNKLIREIKKRRGIVSSNITKRTNYVILPQKVLNSHKENKQIKRNKSKIKFVKFTWLVECMKKKKKVEIKDYLVNISNEIKKVDEIIELYDQYVNYDREEPFYRGVIEEETKIYVEQLDCKYTPYFYNILNGSSTYNPNKDVISRKIGKFSLLSPNYNPKEFKTSRNLDLNIEKKRYEQTLQFIDMYLKMK